LRSNITRSLLVGIIAVTLVGCDSARIDKLEKQNQEILAQLHQQKAGQTYDLEAKCAEEAKRYFNENWRADQMTAGLLYSNHYNRSLNKCFILVRDQTFINPKEEWHRDVTLSDVHERTDYARFVESHSGTSTSLTNCEIAGTSCTSEQDFENRVKPYMTN